MKQNPYMPIAATIDRIVEAVQAESVAQQRSVFDLERSGADAVEEAQSEASLVEQFVRERDPSGVGAREVAGRYEEFLGALQGPTGGPELL